MKLCIGLACFLSGLLVLMPVHNYLWPGSLDVYAVGFMVGVTGAVASFIAATVADKEHNMEEENK